MMIMHEISIVKDLSDIVLEVEDREKLSKVTKVNISFGQMILVVLDVMMNTNLEGYNLLHVIKNDPEYKKMPIILLTGMRDQLEVNLFSAVEDESLFPNVRFQDKPINLHLLVEMIGDMLKE